VEDKEISSKDMFYSLSSMSLLRLAVEERGTSAGGDGLLGAGLLFDSAKIRRPFLLPPEETG
jgi:hypothetical protein